MKKLFDEEYLRILCQRFLYFARNDRNLARNDVKYAFPKYLFEIF